MLAINKIMRVLVDGKEERVVTKEVAKIDNGTLVVLLNDIATEGVIYEKSCYNQKEAGVTLRDADNKEIYLTPDFVVGVLTD